MKQLLLLCLLLVVPAAAQDGESIKSRKDLYRLVAEPLLVPLRINRIHSWKLLLTDSDGQPITKASLSISGGMPAHDHGLATSPRIRELDSPGEYLLEGLRFHMPGEWQLIIEINTGKQMDIVEVQVTL